jgi:hypothetical protein
MWTSAEHRRQRLCLKLENLDEHIAVLEKIKTSAPLCTA